MVVAVIVGVLVVVAVLRVVLRGKDDRTARRQLRQMRGKDHSPNTYGPAEVRRNMQMEQLPGNDFFPGGS
jgi:hypothetical protein